MRSVNMNENKTNKNKIKYDITCYVPGNICNLRCEYCYVSQCFDENHMQKGIYNYPLETMIKAFSPERLGGIAQIGVISGGETLLEPRIIPFVHGLLKQGHVVTIVTNLTLNDKIDELLDFPEEYLKRLIVKGSLHWNELKRLNKVDDYFNNMKKVISKGASSFPFLVCGETYIEHLDEIRETCLSKVNALPHCTPSLEYKQKTDIFRNGKIETSPKCTEEFVNKINNLFDSKIFNLTVKWLSIDPKKIFCYAGKWSFCVDIGTGGFNKCHNCPIEGNFFENLDNMPKLEAVGTNCQVATCALQYNFIAEGIIPEHNDKETYSDILYREGLINQEIKELLDFKFCDDYKQYSLLKQKEISKKIYKQFNEARGHNISFANKIKFKIYRHLEKELRREGVLK